MCGGLTWPSDTDWNYDNDALAYEDDYEDDDEDDEDDEEYYRDRAA